MHLRPASVAEKAEATGGCGTVPNSRALGAGAAGVGNMFRRHAPPFLARGPGHARRHPGNTEFPKPFCGSGLPVPAPPFAQRAADISDANPGAKPRWRHIGEAVDLPVIGGLETEGFGSSIEG